MTSRYAISWINTRILKEELAYAFIRKKKNLWQHKAQKFYSSMEPSFYVHTSTPPFYADKV